MLEAWHGTARTREGADVRFETKLAVVVREDLAVWQKLNVTASSASRSTASGGSSTRPCAASRSTPDGAGRSGA
jgi:hypothetical protein